MSPAQRPDTPVLPGLDLPDQPSNRRLVPDGNFHLFDDRGRKIGAVIRSVDGVRRAYTRCSQIGAGYGTAAEAATATRLKLRKLP